MVEWIIKNSHQIQDLLHCFDDFITVGPHNSPLCAQYLGIVKQVCHTLGLPIHPFKCVEPSSLMVVLSIELDLVAQIARLLTDTLEAAGQLIQQWRPRKWCNPRQLESLTSHLQHDVYSGQILCRMIYLLCCFRKEDYPIRLNLQFSLDVEWWHTFLSSWNGVSSWLFPGMSPLPDIEVVSDASRSLGFSAHFDGAWFSSSPADLLKPQSITYRKYS